MAGYVVNSVANAVTGEVTSRVFSGLVQRYGKDAATSEKLQWLEMLLIKIKSAVEVSEKRTMGSLSLLQWRDKLKEAALEGDEVLANFPHRPKDAQATSNTNNANQQQGEAVSSSAVAPSADVGPLSFTRNSVTNMVQGICNAGKMLFSSVGDDMERLNRTLGRLEKLDIGEFIRLLHLDVLPKIDPKPYGEAPSTKVHGPTEKMGETREKKRMKRSSTSSPSLDPANCSIRSKSYYVMADNKKPSLCFDLLACKSALTTFFPKGRKFVLLQNRLGAALAKILKAVELADSHDLEDLDWLPYWSGILGEAEEQGWDVLHTTNNAKNNQEPVVESKQEDELSSSVHRLEGLVRDVEYFKKLVHLCPAF